VIEGVRINQMSGVRPRIATLGQSKCVASAADRGAQFAAEPAANRDWPAFEHGEESEFPDVGIVVEFEISALQRGHELKCFFDKRFGNEYPDSTYRHREQ